MCSPLDHRAVPAHPYQPMPSNVVHSKPQRVLLVRGQMASLFILGRFSFMLFLPMIRLPRPGALPLATLLALVGCALPAAPPDGNPADAIGSAVIDGAPFSMDALDGSFAEAVVHDDGACRSDETPEYPPGPYDLADNATLPNLHFATEEGGSIALQNFYRPCAAVPRLLVIRTLAAWSGPSQWHAAHTRALMAHADGARLDVLDLLVLGQDNLPATRRDLARWRAHYDALPTALAIDPEYRFRAVFLGLRGLPIVMLVDSRTMRVMRVLVTPASDVLDYEVSVALALLDGRPRPPRPPRRLYDDRFSPDQWDMIRAMTPVPPPPPDPTNRYADDPNAAALGRALFSDPRLTPSGTVSCATCHRPERAFTDGLPRGVGLREIDRNTPSVLFAAWSRWQFWDGRADSLWAQALGPFESAAEMGSSRLYIAHAIARHYAAGYTRVFGPLPPLEDTRRFPPSGKPGDAPWEAMAPADREAVNRVFVNVGKAIAAFERTLRTRPTPFDAYAAGDVNALPPRTRDGLLLFFNNGCIQCHHGPLLTDDSFHNISMPTGRLDGRPDDGRLTGVAALLASPFRADGPYSDAPAMAEHLLGLEPVEIMRGQFRTPSLRATAATGPWGHGGTFTRLEDVMFHYATRGSPTPVPGAAGTPDLHLNSFHFDPETLESLSDLLRALTPDPVTAP